MADAVKNVPLYRTHEFTSADGTVYTWDERQETAMTLSPDELEALRDLISSLKDEIILNDKSGNGIPMGVPVPLSEEKLNVILDLILHVIKFKDALKIRITEHAAERLEQDMLNGPGHPDFRGWLSEEDIEHCVCTIHKVDSARLTVDKRTVDSEIKRFNSPLALEVRGKRTDGTEGTLALALIEDTQIRIITLLKTKSDSSA